MCAGRVPSHSWGLLTGKKAPLALETRYFQRSTHSEETLWRLLCACGQSQQQLTEMRARAAGGAAAGPCMVGSFRGWGHFVKQAVTTSPTTCGCRVGVVPDCSQEEDALSPQETRHIYDFFSFFFPLVEAEKCV